MGNIDRYQTITEHKEVWTLCTYPGTYPTTPLLPTTDGIFVHDISWSPNFLYLDSDRNIPQVVHCQRPYTSEHDISGLSFIQWKRFYLNTIDKWTSEFWGGVSWSSVRWFLCKKKNRLCKCTCLIPCMTFIFGRCHLPNINVIFNRLRVFSRYRQMRKIMELSKFKVSWICIIIRIIIQTW